MSDDYFRTGGGYKFDMRDVLLGGPISEGYDHNDKQWYVVQEVSGRRWEGVGESSVAAVLDLIAQRMEAFPPHRPRRGSDVEAWIKAERDKHDRYGDGTPDWMWCALDNLLDQYRDRADVGLDLTTPAEQIGPHDA